MVRLKNVKSGGAVPCLTPENCPNSWAIPPGDSFMVRGAEYLTKNSATCGKFFNLICRVIFMKIHLNLIGSYHFKQF
jgi:hypothetical protein